jgi:hypothetical protein
VLAFDVDAIAEAELIAMAITINNVIVALGGIIGFSMRQLGSVANSALDGC